MEHAALTPEQLIPLEDIKEGIQLYKKELESQIRAAKINTGIGIGIALCMLVFIVFKPELLKNVMEQIETLTANMNIMGIAVGEGLPMLFGLKSLNSSKEKKKRLDGVRVFEKRVSRMEEGIVPNSQEHILALEEDFELYAVI